MKKEGIPGKDVVSMIWSMAAKSWADGNREYLGQAGFCETNSVISMRRLARATGVDRSSLSLQLSECESNPAKRRDSSFPYLWALLTTLCQPVPETIERAEDNLRVGTFTTLPSPIHVNGVCNAAGEIMQQNGLVTTGRVLQLLRGHAQSANVSIRDIAWKTGCDRTVIQRLLRLDCSDPGVEPFAASPCPKFSRLYDLAKVVGVSLADVVRKAEESN